MEIIKKLKEFHLVLASQSPRRRFLLQGLGCDLTVRPADIDETPQPAELAEDYVRRLASEKACACDASTEEIVIAADTVVVLDGLILGKPRDEAEAKAMLERLSGITHQVLSGVAVRHGDISLTGVEVTEVRFRNLSVSEIDAYVATGEPLDKAGAYGIQGHGGALVADIHGDYPSVVGLPITKLDSLLRQLEMQL